MTHHALRITHRVTMPQKSSPFRYIALAASIAVFLLIVLGGMLSASGSGGACLDWPTCFGRWTPPPASATLDYLHRLATVVVGAFVILAAWEAWRSHRRQPWIIRSVSLALAALAAQIALGAWIVLTPKIGAAAWLSALHLGLSLLVQAALLVSTVVAFYPTLWVAGASRQEGESDGQTTQRREGSSVRDRESHRPASPRSRPPRR